jgi:hypothetical protein
VDSNAIAPKDVLLSAQKRVPGAPHSAVIGAETINAYFDQISRAVQDRLTKEQQGARP